MTTISSFLATPDEVDRAVLLSGEFETFLTLALKNSGERPAKQQLEQARFRAADASSGLRDDLAIDDRLSAWGQANTIRQLIEPCCTIDRARLIHSLWQLQSFEGLKRWLKALGAVVRFGEDAQGRLLGQVLLAEVLVQLVEMVENKDYVLPSGHIANDAITRNLGIRAKVFALDQQRRAPELAGSDEAVERGLQTLSRAHR